MLRCLDEDGGIGCYCLGFEELCDVRMLFVVWVYCVFSDRFLNCGIGEKFFEFQFF